MILAAVLVESAEATTTADIAAMSAALIAEYGMQATYGQVS